MLFETNVERPWMYTQASLGAPRPTPKPRKWWFHLDTTCR
jgi:hypothetical protein